MLSEKFITFITLILSISAISIKPKQTEECCEEYCYDLDTFRDQYFNFATKTPYDLVKGRDTQQYSVAGCEAEKIWILSRHGTRLPSTPSTPLLKELEYLRDEIINSYDSNEDGTLPEQGRLCNEDLELLRNWKWDSNITGECNECLTVEGWNEVKQLAKDYKAAFPDLIDEYSRDKFYFRYTNFQRSQASFKAFAEGLFGDQFYNNITIDPPPATDADALLMPYLQCEAYSQNSVAEDGPDGELAKFRNTEIYRKFRTEMTIRLGLSASGSEELSDQDINSIWETCRFEKNWNFNKSSSWCGTLTESQVKILEYYEDLNYYMKTSYGSEVNLKLACHSMDDMLGHLNSNDSPKVITYFGHIAIIHLHLTAMEAFKDAEAIRSDNFDRMANRKWRTSEICPFTANLAAVKYHCHDDTDAVYKVKFFLNQKPLEFDWCDKGLCKLQDVMEKYRSFNNVDCSSIFCSAANILQSSLLCFLLLQLLQWL